MLTDRYSRVDVVGKRLQYPCTNTVLAVCCKDLSLARGHWQAAIRFMHPLSVYLATLRGNGGDGLWNVRKAKL
jgi:hypothetical protein